MSPLNAHQLMGKIPTDPAVHMEFLNYVHTNDPVLRVLPDPDAHFRIGQEIANNSTQYQGWVYGFLPQYNAAHPDPAPAPTPAAGSPNLISRIDKFLDTHPKAKKALGVGTAVGGASLVALVGSIGMDDGFGKDLLQTCAKLGIFPVSQLSAMYTYIKAK